MSSSIQSVPSELLSGFPIGLWSTDLDFAFTAIIGGESFKERIATSPATIRKEGFHGFDVRYVQHSDILSHLRARSGETVLWETEWRGRVKACVVPALDSDSRRTGVLGAAIDLSILDAAQSRRISAENILFTLLEQGKFAAAILNEENRILFANESYARAHGGLPGQLAIPRTTPHSEASTAKPTDRPVHQAVRIPSPESVGELLTLHLDYTLPTPRSDARPEIDPDTLQAASAEKEKFILHKEIFNGFPKPVALVGPEGTVKTSNAEFTEWAGVETVNVEGVHISTMFTNLTENTLEAIHAELFSSESSPLKSEVELNYSDRSQKILRARVIFSRASTSSKLLMLTISEWDELCSWVDSHAKRKALSCTDRRILELLAGGKNNAQIAAELHLSRQGLDYRIKALRDKLQAESRSALVGRAYTEGLFQVGAWPPRMIE